MPAIRVTRRDVLRQTATASAIASLSFRSLLSAAEAPKSSQGAYREAALRAARWIHTTRIETPLGLTWLTAPERPEGYQSLSDLYTGSAGVVLFLLELGRATGDKAHLEEAAAGADYLAAAVSASTAKGGKIDPDQGEAGLYTGVAGIGTVLERVASKTTRAEHQAAAERCRDLIHAAARPVGAGIEWSDTTDIISGGAGTGLYLLDRARSQNDGASRDLALRAGLRLAELGIAEGEGPKAGRKWRMDPRFARLMPNFSHGTAGVCYFLATLYLETKKPELLAAALAGGRYLLSIADRSGDGCLIFHDEPDNRSLYYLGWCHGPAGTARLFYQLHRATGDAEWLGWARKGAQSILASGIPEHPTPGFWNNVGQCCGSAGVAELFLALHRETGEAKYRDAAQRLAQDLLARGTKTPGDCLKWIHAENRTQPESTYAQTGYMQGAAGIGMLLLRLDALERGAAPPEVLPDSPWGTSTSPPAAPNRS